MSAQPSLPYQLTYFGTQDGLPHNSIKALCQDRDGYLWVGTEAGLCRYNGYIFEQFTQADGKLIGHVRSICETPDGLLWIGTEQGIFYVRHGKIYPVSFSISVKQVRSFVWDDTMGRLWFACASGPYYLTRLQLAELQNQFNTKSVSPVFIDAKRHPGWAALMRDDPRAFSLALDEQHCLWVGNAKNLIKCNESSCVRMWHSQVTNEVTCLLSAGNDSIYFGGNSTSLNGCFNGRIRHFPDSMYYVTDIFKHGKKSFFLAAGALYRIEPTGIEKIWDHPIRVGISDALIDRENNLWVASWEGLIKISPRQFEQFPADKYPELDEIYGLGQDISGNILFGANHGRAFRLFPDGNLKAIHPMRICPNANINDFCNDKQGRCWMATEYEGLAVLESGKIFRLRKQDGLHDDGLFALIPAQKDGIWAIGDGGVSYISTGKSPLNKVKPMISAYGFVEPQEGLTTLVCGVEDPTGNMWFGGNNGLYKMTREGLEKVRMTQYQDLVVSGMSMDPAGQLWISTLGNGVILCKWDKDRWRPVDVFTEKTGLYSNNVLQVMADSRGRIWVGYGFGVGLLEPAVGGNRLIRYFNHRNGLFSKGCRRMQIMEAHDGAFWIATPIGVSLFRPDDFVQNNVAPAVHIRGIRLFDGSVDFLPFCEAIDLQTGLPQHLALPYSLNHLSFTFDGISLTNPENNSFRFMLAGADTHWRIVHGHDMEATYPKLPPGKYTLFIQAANSDGVWTNMPTTFHFQILKPFWQTVWFWCLVIATLLIAVYFISKKRIDAIKRKEAEKARIQIQIADLKIQALRARINPHFIFNCLAGIQECVLQEQFMAANEYLTRFSRLLRMILECGDKTTIPLQRELDMLRMYLELENTRLGQQIDYQINSGGLEEDFTLNVPTLCIQPFAENAIWHGLMHKTGEKKLRIDLCLKGPDEDQEKTKKKFSAEEKIICISICDNGIGRAKSGEMRKYRMDDQSSMGINIIENRLRLMHPNAAVRYEDLYDHDGLSTGTCVYLEIPLVD